MFYIRQLLALCLSLILSSIASKTSQEPAFVSLLASGHCIYVVLELVTQHARVGCSGVSADLILQAYSTWAHVTLPDTLRSPVCMALGMCTLLQHWLAQGVIFMLYNASRSGVGQMRTLFQRSRASQRTNPRISEHCSCHNIQQRDGQQTTEAVVCERSAKKEAHGTSCQGQADTRHLSAEQKEPEFFRFVFKGLSPDKYSQIFRTV